MVPPLARAAALGVTTRAMIDEQDLPFVAALYASTRRDEVATTGWPEDMQAAFLRQQHEAQHRHYRAQFADGQFLILQQAGQAIGRLYLHADGQHLQIVDISLVADHRGQGIGGALLQDLIDATGSAGLTLGIHVEKTNPARRLYDRLGFALVKDLGVYDYLEAGRPS